MDTPMFGDIYKHIDCILERIQQILEEWVPILYGTHEGHNYQ